MYIVIEQSRNVYFQTKSAKLNALMLECAFHTLIGIIDRLTFALVLSTANCGLSEDTGKFHAVRVFALFIVLSLMRDRDGHAEEVSCVHAYTQGLVQCADELNFASIIYESGQLITC